MKVQSPVRTTTCLKCFSGMILHPQFLRYVTVKDTDDLRSLSNKESISDPSKKESVSMTFARLH